MWKYIGQNARAFLLTLENSGFSGVKKNARAFSPRIPFPPLTRRERGSPLQEIQQFQYEVEKTY